MEHSTNNPQVSANQLMVGVATCGQQRQQTLNQSKQRPPRGERRVRFAESPAATNNQPAMDVVTLLLTDIVRERTMLEAKNRELVRKLEEVTAKNYKLKNELDKALAIVNSLEQEASLVCEFAQPISSISFREKVKLNKVNLETCNVTTRSGNATITCTVRVLNQSYEKNVIIRYTADEWQTYTDCKATFIPTRLDANSVGDQFSCSFNVTNAVKRIASGQRIMFAIMYTFDNKVFWDNNGGLNYSIRKM